MIILFLLLELILCVFLFGLQWGLIIGIPLVIITNLLDNSRRNRKRAEEKRHQDHKEQQDNIKALQREIAELRKAQDKK